MSSFEDFVFLELPKRPWIQNDGAAGQLPVRSNDPLKRLELVWVDAPGAKVSTDPDNAVTIGTDGGIFVQQFEWTTTQW